MKKLFILSIFILTISNTQASIYERYDIENECTLYYSGFSSFFVEGTRDRRVSIKPALNFDKYKNIYNLKGLWSMMPLVENIKVGDQADYYMKHVFNHACVTEDHKILYISEPKRELRSNRNDYDRETE